MLGLDPRRDRAELTQRVGVLEAARRLFGSEATIKTHLLHIYDKLGVRDRAAAVGEAYKRGLLY